MRKIIKIVSTFLFSIILFNEIGDHKNGKHEDDVLKSIPTGYDQHTHPESHPTLSMKPIVAIYTTWAGSV